MTLPLAHLYGRQPLILGHRGASAYAPENTLSAFERALAMGADGFELDVALSADGVPVVLHDDRLDRTTNGTGPVSQSTVKELKQLDAGYAARFGEQFRGEALPTLDEVFEAFGQRAIINVELKRDRSPKRMLAQRVVALIHARGLQQRVIVSSFQFSNLACVKQLDPALPVGLLYALPAFAARLLRRLMPDIVHEAHHPECIMLTAGDIRWYHDRGLRVNTWTANDEKTLRRLMADGVDGIITDCPDVAVRIREQLWPQSAVGR